MRLFYLGDIHGNFSVIHQYVKKFDIKNAHIIQVGDFGVGFKSIEKEKRLLQMYHDLLVKNNVIVWAIRGNHDYKPHFDSDPFGLTNIKLIPDYTILELCGKKILCVGGAVSVDRTWRYTFKQKMGIFENQALGVESWWPDEIFQLDKDKICEMRDIDIVVTHTCPHYCPPDNTFGFGPFVEGIIRDTGDTGLKTDLNVERQAMTDLFHLLKMNGNNIEKHYYGHFHNSEVQNYDGCEHRMLGIGELWEENL
jgi:predicted phosphodiesterase